MARGRDRIAQTPATRVLNAAGVAFEMHPYEYVDHGGTHAFATALGVDEHAVVKTLVMQDDRREPLAVLMHGTMSVATGTLARAIGARSVQPCTPEVAERHTGYRVGGISPFGMRRAMPVYAQQTILALPRIWVNGGRRGLLVSLEPAVLQQLLPLQPVSAGVPGVSVGSGGDDAYHR